MAVLQQLKRLKVDIALLQESHLKTTDFLRMWCLWVREVLGSLSDGGKAGVLVLLH